MLIAGFYSLSAGRHLMDSKTIKQILFINPSSFKFGFTCLKIQRHTETKEIRCFVSVCWFILIPHYSLTLCFSYSDAPGALGGCQTVEKRRLSPWTVELLQLFASVCLGDGLGRKTGETQGLSELPGIGFPSVLKFAFSRKCKYH